MRFSTLSFIALVFFCLPGLASAGEVVVCGVPEAAEMDTAGKDYCNLYQRRFAYREEAMKLRQKIHERRENYHAPQSSAVRAYEADLEALNAERGAADMAGDNGGGAAQSPE